MSLLPLAPLLAVLAAYAGGVARLRARGTRWPRRRLVLHVLGVLCLGAALLPLVASHDEAFPVHAAQHVVLTAVAPLLLVRAAPVLLALRALQADGGARRVRALLLRVLHGRAVAVLVRTEVVVALQVVPAYALYLAPLYGAAERHPALHALVHAHAVAGGLLLATWAAGLDPLPGRPRVRTRLVALAVVAAAHDVLCTLLYAHGLPRGADTASGLRQGAQVLYYGAGAAELALAVVLLGDWWRRGTRELARDRRRAAVPDAPHPRRAGPDGGAVVVPSAT